MPITPILCSLAPCQKQHQEMSVYTEKNSAWACEAGLGLHATQDDLSTCSQAVPKAAGSEEHPLGHSVREAHMLYRLQRRHGKTSPF